MRKPTRPTAEIARLLGKEIYDLEVRPRVEGNHYGEYVAIDVKTGDWAIADSDRAALEILRSRRPDAVDVLMERVGYRALHSFGGATVQGIG